MPGDEVPSGYRVVQLVQRDPPDDVLRQAEMIPGEAGRYARIIRYRHDLSRTVYEVLQFKAGRPPTREEVVADLKADLARIDAELKELDSVGAFGAWVDRKLFSGVSAEKLKKQRDEIEETLRAIEEEYGPGEAVCVP